MAKRNVEIKWLNAGRDEDYQASKIYLSLIYEPSAAEAYVERLKRAPWSEYKAKDIFRASTLPQLEITNHHVQKNVEKVEAGEQLAPLILVRDSPNGKVIIADGYHRLCAVNSYD